MPMKTFDSIKRMILFWRYPKPSLPFYVLFMKFKSILERNNSILELMGDMGDKLGGEYVFDLQYIKEASEKASDIVFKLISDLCILTKTDNVELFIAFERIRNEINEELAGRRSVPVSRSVIGLGELSSDFSDEVGNKFAGLGDIRNILGLPTPDGFVFTTKAFFDFMEHNRLFKYIEKALSSWNGNDEPAFYALCEDVRKRVLSSNVPKSLSSGLNSMLKQLSSKYGYDAMKFAVRSSALGEDSKYSFAGQYESILNVSPEGIIEAYKEVVASAYTPEAWHYRLHRGYKEHEMAMAVGCQLMIQAKVSGAMYTYAPLPVEKESMVISSAWGLGPAVVQGVAESDMFILDRLPPHRLISEEIESKDRMLVSDSGHGTVWRDVPIEMRDNPSLTSGQIEHLAQSAMNIERYYKRPQDIEWAFDKDGNLFLLQARPVNIRPEIDQARPDIDQATSSAEVIFSGKGIAAQLGVAAGKVFVSSSDDDLKDFPYGAILVTKYTSPKYARIMSKAHGIITDVGSPTGHMATLAREYRIPAIVDTGVATKLLKTGDEITLDATQNKVYRGTLKELAHFELAEIELFEETYEYRLLKRLLRKIYPLHLVDSMSEGFRPESCRTYHDITRYIHEKAVEKLIDLSENYQKYHDKVPKRFKSSLPLGLMIIDIEGGLDVERNARSARLEQITSVPLWALLDGLFASGMWKTDPVSMDMGSFMSSLTRSLSSAHHAPSSTDRNLAVVSREYMNLNLKLGYHFTVVNAYIGENTNDNYIFFRFMGGVTDFLRRSRRARFIAEVLEHLDFLVEVHGDLVAGRLKKISKERMCSHMRIIGALIGYTRQLDVAMKSDEHVSTCMDDFIQRIRSFTEVTDGRS